MIAGKKSELARHTTHGNGLPVLYLFSLRSYVLFSRGGAESAEKSPEINLRVSARK